MTNITDHASWLNGINLGGSFDIRDRWFPKPPKKNPVRACTGPPECRWCNHQQGLQFAGKKSKPLDQCPWRGWTPPAQTIPATERWELVRVVSLGGRHLSPPPVFRHIGYYATREAAEAAKHGQ
jgi:hypothetical protein